MGHIGRKLAWTFLACAGLVGCVQDPGPVRNEFGIYVIGEEQHAFVYDRLVNALNARRRWIGAPPLRVDAFLSASAKAHADNLAIRNFPTPFGIDGSSPYVRFARSGYQGELVAEMYLAADATETEALQRWSEDPAWGLSLLDQDATDVGLGWHQNPDGVYWWVLILGEAAPLPNPADPIDPAGLSPAGTVDVAPVVDPAIAAVAPQDLPPPPVSIIPDPSFVSAPGALATSPVPAPRPN